MTFKITKFFYYQCSVEVVLSYSLLINRRSRPKVKQGGLMKLFTPFTIPKKDNCDLCRIKTSRRTKAENPFLDQLFKTLYRDRFDFVFDWVGLIHFFPHWRITSQEENSNRSDKWEQIFKLLQHCFNIASASHLLKFLNHARYLPACQWN